MSTYFEKRMAILDRRLRARVKKDGTPLPGFAGSVASIRAELAMLSERADKGNVDG